MSARGTSRRLRRSPQFLLAVPVLAVLAAVAVAPGAVSGLFSDAGRTNCDIRRSRESPSGEHPFGFDLQGCDYLVQTAYGARTSASVALLVVGVAVLVALVLGSLAGYFGGWVDVVVSRVTDAWFTIPVVLGGILILSFVESRGVLTVSSVLALFAWPPMVRLLRASVLQAKGAEYVLAARALGAGDARLLRRHVLPHAVRPLAVYATVYAGIVVAAEATLSFLGVGLQLPAVSWGILLFTAQDYVRGAPHLLVFPAGALSLSVMAFVLLGEALRGALDPRED